MPILPAIIHDTPFQPLARFRGRISRQGGMLVSKWLPERDGQWRKPTSRFDVPEGAAGGAQAMRIFGQRETNIQQPHGVAAPGWTAGCRVASTGAFGPMMSIRLAGRKQGDHTVPDDRRKKLPGRPERDRNKESVDPVDEIRHTARLGAPFRLESIAA